MANGSCLCKQVKFTISGQASSMSHCHCSMCRKIHGALFATYFNTQQVEFLDGKQHIDQYESSSGFTRSFCHCCGSPLPEKSPDGKSYYVPAGLMDDDPGVRPDKHIFVESKAECYDITDALPQQKHYGDNDLSRVIETASAPHSSNNTTGGCLCGNVQFEFSGKPNFIMNCHCSRCRKVKGAAHATNAFVDNNQLRWTSGQNNVTDYPLPGAKFFGHAFCKTCGSSVPRLRNDGSVYNIPVGSLNQSPGIDAKGHIFTGSKAPWFDISCPLTQWEEMPT